MEGFGDVNGEFWLGERCFLISEYKSAQDQAPCGEETYLETRMADAASTECS